MGRQPCCDKIGLKRGPWTIEEDHKLMNFILNNGIQCWRLVPKLAGLMRCGKSCRLRWINYLRPDLKRGAITEAEEDMIIQLHSRYGNRWSKIASHFPGRTDNEIKNHWNTRIKKRLKLLGLDPITHKPIGKQEIFSTDEKENQENNSSDLDSHDNQEGEGASKGPDPDENNFSHNKEMFESLELRSDVISEVIEPSNEFYVNMSTEPICDDFYQQWIDSPNNMLSWDGFSNFEEIFL